MRTYLKCVWWNKFTLIGYVCSLFGLITICYDFGLLIEGFLIFWLGLGIAAATLFGRITLSNYHWAVLQLQEEKSSSVQKAIGMAAYCNKVGLVGALKEYEKRGGH
jgi:hypothetical protein